MSKTIINKEVGSSYIAEDFSINCKTTLDELKNYFGLERLKVKSARKTYRSATLYDIKISDWYFIMSFYFDVGRLKHIIFYPRDEELNAASLDNFNPEVDRDYYTNWMAA